MELANRAPALAVFGVISVAAYLIGTLVEDLVRWARERSDRSRRFEELPDLGKRPRATASLPADISLHLLVSERVREAQARLKAEGQSLHAIPDTLLGKEFEAFLAWKGETDESREATLAIALHGQTLRELDLVGFRLMGDEPVLYGNVDRTRAEAELRVAVAVPLLLIGAALAFRTKPWGASVALAAAFAFVAAILIWQAQGRKERANDALVDAVFIGKVEAPAMDQLRRATNEVLAETPEQRKERERKQTAERKKRRDYRKHLEKEYADEAASSVGC